jgi:spore germination cell wall hydrolase CwlJ-like protein
MVALRTRPKGARSASFGLSTMVFILIPTQVGFQDLAALIARQPAVTARWREHVVATPFNTMRAATFSFPRPVGTSIPEPVGYTLASLDPRGLDLTASLPERAVDSVIDIAGPALQYPSVERRLKGDALVKRSPSEPANQPEAQSPRKDQDRPGAPPKTARTAVDNDDVEAIEMAAPFDDSPPLPVQTLAKDTAAADHDTPDQLETLAERAPVVALATPTDPTQGKPFEANPSDIVPVEPSDLNELDQAAPDAVPSTEHAAVQTARLYFGSDAVDGQPSAMERWAPGEEPVLMTPPAADPDIKLSALDPKSNDAAITKDVAPSPDGETGGETVAPKGEVTGEGKRPRTPADRLGLDSKTRPKHEKCLADAIYFESRGEQVRGQMAVAQVVMNRAFSGYYPNNVCGVVYQNAHRRLACQFTFACDGIPDVIKEPDMWEQAKRIAKDTLDGKFWLPEVGKATHYHASWVRPSWVREMQKLQKLGVHTFYRPRNWGDGADKPIWGTPPTAQDIQNEIAKTSGAKADASKADGAKTDAKL